MAERNDPDELDVDARFLLANERTLLAWVRTSLAFIASGVGVQQFATELPGRRLIALSLILIGAVCAAAGATRFMQADKALRAGRLPHVGNVPLIVSWLVVVIALGAVAAVIAGAL